MTLLDSALKYARPPVATKPTVAPTVQRQPDVKRHDVRDPETGRFVEEGKR